MMIQAEVIQMEIPVTVEAPPKNIGNTEAKNGETRNAVME